MILASSRSFGAPCFGIQGDFFEACTPQHTASIGCAGFADVADDIPELPVGRPLAASISPERIVEVDDARQNT